jgi:hypothetical protein
MTATVAPVAPTSTPTTTDRSSSSTPTLWRAGLVAGLAAAAATVAVAATASALDVSLEASPGQAIPVIGFGQLTLLFTAVGVLMARILRSRAREPRTTFTRTTIVLTVLSVVPDVMLSTDGATKLTLVLTHLVAAAIVIPALSSRLPVHSTR